MTDRVSPGPRAVSGIVLIDKPAGATSNRVLQRMKRLFRARKAGHTGTLDPMATGMLPICFGVATKVAGLMLSASKRYRVDVLFGAATDTGDATGSTIETREIQAPVLAEMQSAVAGMRGPLDQIPPMYSALKHQGKRLYELAREGREVERAARRVEILEFELEAFDWPRARLQVHCSKGTYVRSLVTDLAGRLGTVAHVTALRRLSVSPFEESQMVSTEELEEAASGGNGELDRWILGIDTALIEMPEVLLDEPDAAALRHGRPVEVLHRQAEGRVRVYQRDAGFIGVGDFADTGQLRPVRIFPK